MPYVTDDVGVAPEHLPASVEIHTVCCVRNSLKDRVRKLDSQNRHHGQHSPEVLFLPFSLEVHHAWQLFEAILQSGLRIRKDQRAADGRGRGLEHGSGLLVPCPDHGRDAGLEDPGLFAGYGGSGIAQLGAMVEPYAGDDSHFRSYDVGAVQAAAEANLDDGDIDLFL